MLYTRQDHAQWLQRQREEPPSQHGRGLEEKAQQANSRTLERRQKVRDLKLTDNCIVIVKTQDGPLRGRFDSVEESTYRVWVRGIDPLTANNPRLCCPLNILEVQSV